MESLPRTTPLITGALIAGTLIFLMPENAAHAAEACLDQTTLDAQQAANAVHLEEWVKAHWDSIVGDVERISGMHINHASYTFLKDTDYVSEYNVTTDTVELSAQTAQPFMETPHVAGCEQAYGPSTRTIITHEVAHDLFYQEHHALSVNGTLNTFWKQEYAQRNMSAYIVSEGFARFVENESGERAVNAATPDFVSLRSSGEVQEFGGDIGARMLEPIFKEVGIEKGLKAILMSEPPAPYELMNPDMYQARILADARTL